MIHTVSNPKMTANDVKLFRKNFERCVSKDMTPFQLSEIKRRQHRMKNVYERILRNNGGKNPILGY